MAWSVRAIGSASKCVMDAHGNYDVADSLWSTSIPQCVVEGLPIWELNREPDKA
jgi:hypothetical protein